MPTSKHSSPSPKPAPSIGRRCAFAAALIGYSVSAVVLVVDARLRRGAAAGRALDRAGVLWFGLVGLCNGAAVLAMYAGLGRIDI